MTNITSAVEVTQAGGWQPIDSAPRDYTDVIAYDPAYNHLATEGVLIAWYDAEAKQWLAHNCQDFVPFSPTHWQPLPNPPANIEQAG